MSFSYECHWLTTGKTGRISKFQLLHVIWGYNEHTVSQCQNAMLKIHSCPKLKLQPVLWLSSFLHNSSINEHKNMKLRENIHYETNNWILYYWGFGNNLKVNINDFFLKNYVLKTAKILMFFRKEIKWKVEIIMLTVRQS